MDQSTQEIKKYIDNLIPVVRTAVLSPEWRKRVGEIGQKYSLHLDQIASMEYEVLFVIIGMEPEEEFVENIKKELNISNVLATQIAEEVDTRVFQYILKLMQNQMAGKPERFEESTIDNQQSTNKTQNQASLLSTMEKMADVEAHFKEVEPPVNLPGEVEVTSSQPSFNNRDTPGNLTQESKIQNPTSTFVDTKLNSIVTSTQQTIVKNDTQKQKETPLVHSYTADPYREPIE